MECIFPFSLRRSRKREREREKRERALVPLPNKRFDPLKKFVSKTLSMKNFAEAINKVSPQSILHTAILKPKVDFVRERISAKFVQPKKVFSLSDVSISTQ